MIEERLINRKKFSTMVEDRVRRDNIGYIDSILALCEEHGLDPGDTNSLLNNIIKGKLEAEAVQLNYIKGGNSLPI